MRSTTGEKLMTFAEIYQHAVDGEDKGAVTCAGCLYLATMEMKGTRGITRMECRRNTPTLGPNGRGEWPAVQPYFWCGHFLGLGVSLDDVIAFPDIEPQ